MQYFLETTVNRPNNLEGHERASFDNQGALEDYIIEVIRQLNEGLATSAVFTLSKST